MAEPSIFVGIPLYDNYLHFDCVCGLMKTLLVGGVSIQTARGCYVSNNRDALTSSFLESGSSHFLCLDSDIGWEPMNLQQLLDADLDVVSGTYCRKNDARDIPAKFLPERTGELQEVEWAPGGFLLIKRAVIEKMRAAYPNLAYERDGVRRDGLWTMKGATGEDVAFCERWRAIGGRVFMHLGCVLRHYGEQCFTPGGAIIPVSS